MNTDLFLIGIDGGGTGTRVVLGDAQGRELAQAASGPSGLGLGVERAWQAIEAGCGEAFERAGVALDWSRCVLGCGLAGVNNRDWLAAFHAQAPAVAGLAVESDAYTTLLGAHGGAHGVIVALGTGSVAAVARRRRRMPHRQRLRFPSGDEASGAWLGLRPIVHAQQALDGRVPADDLAQALLAHTGAHDRDSLVVWLCAANQTAYARLAPIAHRASHASVRGASARRGRRRSRQDDCRARPFGHAAGRAVRRPRCTACASMCRRAIRRACASRWRIRRTAVCSWRSAKRPHRRLRIGWRAGAISRIAAHNGKMRSLTLPGCSHHVQSHCHGSRRHALNADHQVDPFTVATVRKLESDGLHFVIATGRHYCDVAGIRDLLGIRPYLITSNGARIHAPDNTRDPRRRSAASHRPASRAAGNCRRSMAG